ncbi:MAG: prolipoprotein diacylglyceryl transferase [Clostridia bacterium]|nr:prolipoprotein diacylglyceryl transferase [Clostridia bacterium]
MDFVSFPELGWRFNISQEIYSFTIGGHEFAIRWYGLLIAIGFLLAVVYAYRRANEFRLSKDAMTDVVLVCTLFAFVGARLYYVIFSEDRAAYFNDPLSILRVWEGGLAIYGGVIGAFVTALWMCPLKKVDTMRMFDLAAPGFLIGQAIGRWGNFFNQEAFGGNTTLPWGMTGSIIGSPYANATGYDPTQPVHPTFLYESLWCLLGLVLLHIVSKKAYRFRGQLFSLYIMWYGTGRFFIEQLRTDSLYIGTMPVSCLVAAVSVVGGLVLYFVLKNRDARSPKDLFADEPLPAEGEILPTAEEEEATTGSAEETESTEEAVLTEEEDTNGNQN